MLLHESPRMQVVEVEVPEFRAEVLLQVRPGVLGDLAQVAQRAPGLGGELRQLVRTEYQQREDTENQELRE